jgi:phenylalanyl-tRNA synthetase beta chain
MTARGKKYKLRRTSHDSFIEGRTAKIIVNNKTVGIIGEIHPAVLGNWKLVMPVACFEIELI